MHKIVQDVLERHRPGSSCQILVLSVRNVLTGPVVSVLFGQSKVDQEEFVAVTPNTHQEVVWLDVTMNEILIVDVSEKNIKI